MTLTHDSPCIYVANLAAYNAGQLIGEWVTVTDDAGDMLEQVHRISRGGDWAVHDQEGFGTYVVGEHPSLDLLAAMVRTASQMGGEPGDMLELVALYVDMVGANYVDTDTLPDDFSDAYAGVYESFTDYAAEYVDDMLAGIPDDHPARTYFDVDRFAQDLEDDYYVVRFGFDVAVFHAY